MVGERSSSSDSLVKGAFGEINRVRLIREYFATLDKETRGSRSAWVHVYKLLLWIDQTTGLGHCYESDKCQPGKPWYGRSLAFHDWVSNEFEVQPAELAAEIDWLFIRATEDLAKEVRSRSKNLSNRAEEQRAPYEGRSFPSPGDDPEMAAIVDRALEAHLSSAPTVEVWSQLTQEIRQYVSLANKRKNLVGEGFEDVLCEIFRHHCQDGTSVSARKALSEIPGFGFHKKEDKPNKVDIAIISDSKKTLITAKWSVRADREKQFLTDFDDYVGAKSESGPFDYIFITNEFDPARLKRACELEQRNALIFTKVVHVNTNAIVATYNSPSSKNNLSDSMRSVVAYIESGRLVSLDSWLNEI